ncbi:TetR/AcrR family transcriptional regulator [Mycoplasma sp. P36-A1]|uniref:TetR/AcrR family transcriptional regulator n=1 Tax=Mycoplasma sp. P36-A1 TaxID=3252900 RepID=UPI003C2FCD3E
MKNKENIKITQTKKAIKIALFALLKEYDIHDISVKSICEKANINRGTFYHHYKNPLDLLSSLEQELLDKIEKLLVSTPIYHYQDLLLINVLEIIKENKELCMVIFFNQQEMKIVEKLMKLINKTSMLSIITSNSNMNELEFNYFMQYTIGGSFAIIQTWIKRDFSESIFFIKEMIINTSNKNIDVLGLNKK